MPISKRVRPKPITPPRKIYSPAIIAHRKQCDDLYNRLQQSNVTSFAEVDLVVILKLSGTLNTVNVIEAILARFDSQVKTIQINHPGNHSYQVMLQWTDREKGYPFPRKYVVKHSPSLALSAMLAYVTICKSIGRFL
jgi:hypothetical protein